MEPLTTEKEYRILQVARDVFLEKGRQGARMQEIAERAGVNKALLHYYFRSKERLYRRVFEEEVLRFFKNFMDTIPAESDFKTFLQEFVSNYLHQVANSPQLVRFVLWEIREEGEVLTGVLQRLFQGDPVQNNPFIRRVLQAVQDGEIRPTDPKHLFFSVVGMCVYPIIAGPLLERLFPNLSVTDEQFIKERAQEVFQLLWQGLQPTT